MAPDMQGAQQQTLMQTKERVAAVLVVLVLRLEQEMEQEVVEPQEQGLETREVLELLFLSMQLITFNFFQEF